MHSDAHWVEIVAGNHAFAAPGERTNAAQHGGVYKLRNVGHFGAGFDSEMEIPHQLFECSRRVGGGLIGGRCSDVATEAFGADPPSVAVGVDQSHCLKVREGHMGKRIHVVAARRASIVPRPEKA